MLEANVQDDDGRLPPRRTSARTTWANLNKPFTAGFSLTLGGLAAITLGLALSNLTTIVIYVTFALFAALGLDPLVRALGSRGLTRAWGIVAVYGVFALALVGVLALVIPPLVRQLGSFVKDMPAIIADFEASEFFEFLRDNFGDQVDALLAQAEALLFDPANLAAIGGGVVQVGVGIGSAVSGIIIVLVLSLYFLASLPAMKATFTRLFPARSRRTVASMTEQIATSIGGYLGGMVVLALINAAVVFMLYLILGLPFPLLLAVGAFCITLIPLVGSVLFWIVGSLIALFSSPGDALIFAAAYLVYMQLEAYLLTPRVMNRTISVPGSLVVIGALVGGTLLGLLGALIAIPVTASLLLIIKQVLIPRQDLKT